MSNHLRMSCMSGTYCNAQSREKILEVLTWSFTCLSISSAFDWTVQLWHLGSQQSCPSRIFKVLEFGHLKMHGAKASPVLISQSDGPWQGNGLQGHIKLYWRVYKEIKTTFVFFSTPHVSSVCMSAVFCTVYFGGPTKTTIRIFWQMYEHQRLFCEAVLLLLLSSFELGLWRWEPRVEKLSLHLLWAAGFSQKHVPKIWLCIVDSVDERNPARVDMVDIPIIYRVSWCRIFFINSSIWVELGPKNIWVLDSFVKFLD